MANIAAIIAGAGESKRFGKGSNKILKLLEGIPVFLRAIRAFALRKDVNETVFVCSAAEMADILSRWGNQLDELSVKIVEGGTNRTESVRNGLGLVSDTIDMIAVHDAARPCVPYQLISEVFKKAMETGAALPAIRVCGTIKRAGPDGRVIETLSREKYTDIHEVQTPQVFRRDLLTGAYDSKKPATDDAAMVEAAGGEVYIVPGDRKNVKITTPDDFAFAETIVRSMARNPNF